MQLSTLGMILLVIAALIGIRMLVFKVLKSPVEQPSILPVETTTSQEGAEASPTTIWPTVIMLCVVVTLIVSTMFFGRVLEGG